MSAETLLHFNVNESVRVQLTNLGRRIHRENFDRAKAEYEAGGKSLPLGYTPPQEDAAGWSEWQLWSLMEEFGPSCGNGSPVAFATDILIPRPAAL